MRVNQTLTKISKFCVNLHRTYFWRFCSLAKITDVIKHPINNFLCLIIECFFKNIMISCNTLKFCYSTTSTWNNDAYHSSKLLSSSRLGPRIILSSQLSTWKTFGVSASTSSSFLVSTGSILKFQHAINFIQTIFIKNYLEAATELYLSSKFWHRFCKTNAYLTTLVR